MFGSWGELGGIWLGALAAAALLHSSTAAAEFRFDRDTFAFQNATVLKYHDGIALFRPKSEASDPANSYTRRCFVMTRTAMQFRKFARFNPHGAALNDQELAQRIRAVAHRKPWLAALPENQRIVFPGYSNLREISKARTQVFENNIGSGFVSYFRPSNMRMVFLDSKGYQEKTHQNLDAALARGDTFVAFLTTYPKMSINHAVLVYGRKKSRPGDEIEHYLVYDPNHAEAPRELTWSARECAFAYQKDIDFIGGFVRVYQAYDKPLQ
ncbi:MAG: hypothetical protein DME65_04190 [Verrucomicrobia bacterium]|nr:MAG: hypothetical protein DME65_04190 [Verrucomicrobiota bacterium]